MKKAILTVMMFFFLFAISGAAENSIDLNLRIGGGTSDNYEGDYFAVGAGLDLNLGLLAAGVLVRNANTKYVPITALVAGEGTDIPVGCSADEAVSYQVQELSLRMGINTIPNSQTAKILLLAIADKALNDPLKKIPQFEKANIAVDKSFNFGAAIKAVFSFRPPTKQFYGRRNVTGADMGIGIEIGITENSSHPNQRISQKIYSDIVLYTGFSF